MKLYTNILAEKLVDGKITIVKKSQGSNTHMYINIVNDKGYLLAHVKVNHREGDKPVVYFYTQRNHAYEATSPQEYEAILSIEKTKGNKQKDEATCYNCDSPLHNGHCPNKC